MDARPPKKLSFLNGFKLTLLMSTNWPKANTRNIITKSYVGVLHRRRRGRIETSSDRLLPVKHTGHLKVPPMPSKLCSIRWHWSLAGESNVWLQSLHSWFSPSSVGKMRVEVKITMGLQKSMSYMIYEQNELFLLLSSGNWMPLIIQSC